MTVKITILPGVKKAPRTKGHLIPKDKVSKSTPAAARFLPALLAACLLPAGTLSADEIASTSSEDTYKGMSLSDLMQVDVFTVTRTPEKLSESASAAQVITGEEIRRSGATSIPEALRLADNLEVAQKGSHGWAISARGFNTDSANKLLVLMDGRSVYTPLFSGVFWDQQDYLLADIDRIEVISGPGGTLWGANAVNGVINVISKNARDTQGLYVEGGGGSELQDFGAVRYGGALSSNVFYRVYGKYFDRDSAVFPNGNDAMDSWRMGQGGFRLDAQGAAADTFTLQGDGYSDEEHLATGGVSRDNGNNILGRWTHTVSDNSDLRLQLYYDRTHLRNDVPGNAFAGAGILTDDLNTYDLDLQHRFPLGERNEIIWGLGYRFTQDQVGNAPALAFVPADLDHNLYSGFLQDKFIIVKPLSLTLGTKVEHNDYTGFEFEPSGRLAWSMTDHQTLWASVSRAVRDPSRVDRDIRLPTPVLAPGIPNLLVGGRDFSSENEMAYELGYRAQLNNKLSSSLSTFFNVYDDVRSTGTSPPPAFLGLPLIYQNNLEGETYGLELSLSYQVTSWWRLHGGYTLLEEDLRVKSGKTDFNHALNETADPEHQFSLRSSMDLPGNLEFDTDVRWVDSFTYNNSGVPATVPDYFELDARLAWHPTKNLELSIVGQNILHDQHLEYVISSPNPREEIERGIYGKITMAF